MTHYEVRYLREALDELKALPAYVRSPTRRMIGALRSNPYPSKAKELDEVDIGHPLSGNSNLIASDAPSFATNDGGWKSLTTLSLLGGCQAYEKHRRRA